jgi:hypothetical protein
MESPGFYLHAENKVVLIGVGIKMFTKPLLDRCRQAVVDKKPGPELKNVRYLFIHGRSMGLIRDDEQFLIQ